MANFNKVLLIGNLTRDPQLSYLPSQTPVVEFGLAVNRKWKDQQGNAKEEVCFVDCRAYARLAENINKYMKKGRPLFVEGRLTYETWTGQDGAKKSRHRVTVENFQFLDSAGGAGAKAQSAPGAEETAQESPPDTPQQGGDDIPF